MSTATVGSVPLTGAEAFLSVINVATCSFVNGPRRYDIAQRVVSSRGFEVLAETTRN